MINMEIQGNKENTRKQVKAENTKENEEEKTKKIVRLR